MTVTEKTRPAGPEPVAGGAVASVRDRILDVAQELFAEHGYSAASTRAIAQAAGVNLAQLHYHAGAKGDLLKAACLRGGVQVPKARRRALAEARAAHAGEPIP